ncbi:hypothetical protein D3C71_1711910 [compost metagenome]
MTYTLLTVEEVTNLLHLTDRHFYHSLGQNLMNSRILQLRRHHQCFRIYVVTGVHGNFIAPFGLNSKFTSAQFCIVNDIIVN